MRLYRWLLRLCPASLRREYGGAMEETFARRLSDSRGAGVWQRGRVWRRELAGLLALAASERWEAAGRARRRPYSIESGRKAGHMDVIRGWTALENFARDLRHALRQLRKHPGFTAVAVGTLALGLGSTTAMFSVVKGVLLEPLPYRDPSRLFLAYARFPLLSWQKGPVNARHFHEWRPRCRACESVALVDGVVFGVAGRGEPRRVPGLRVSANLFRTLGVAPALGRDFPRRWKRSSSAPSRSAGSK
jgi:hypothetical protein